MGLYDVSGWYVCGWAGRHWPIGFMCCCKYMMLLDLGRIVVWGNRNGKK